MSYRRRMRAEIEAYYERGGEVERLASGAGRLEFLRTWDVLTRVLPPPPARVLDVGGATGVYAAPLAEAGYDVALVDPVASQVAVAATLPGVTAAVGDARALEVRDDSVDAVLLLGPLYHLTDRADRLRAWREAARVTRPGGVVVAATISRYASLLDGFIRGLLDDPDFLEVVRGDLISGVHRNPEHVAGWFTTAYFHRPEEIRPERSLVGQNLQPLGCGNDAHVHVDLLGIADANGTSLLKDAQNDGLNLQRNALYVLKDEGTALRILERTRAD